jgi:hypothetical protein
MDRDILRDESLDDCQECQNCQNRRKLERLQQVLFLGSVVHQDFNKERCNPLNLEEGLFLKTLAVTK